MSNCKKLLIIFLGFFFIVLGVECNADLAPVIDITQSASQSNDSQSSDGGGAVSMPANINNNISATPTADTNSSVTPTPNNVSQNNLEPSAADQNDNNVADVNPTPVADNTANNTPTTPAPMPDTSGMSVQQRLARLEQQMANLTQMNLPQQISDIQQQLQQLQGELQVQSHDLQLLNKQQRTFYQDLDQRMNQLKNLNQGNTSESAPSSNNNLNKPMVANDTSTPQLNDANAYRNAFDLLLKKQYDPAKTAFLNYLTTYPNGQYVANAHFWLGEVYLTQKNNQQAQSEFTTVIQHFPGTEKVSDAKLKLAMIHSSLGKVAQARQELMAIKKDYPDSTAAQLAAIQLQQLDLMKNNLAQSSNNNQ